MSTTGSYLHALQTALLSFNPTAVRASIKRMLHRRAKALFFGVPIPRDYIDLIELAHGLASCGQVEAVHMLLDAGFPVDTILSERKNWYCDTMLEAAVAAEYRGRVNWDGKQQMITVLLLAGADPSRPVRNLDFPGCDKPLTSVINSLPVARLFVESGVPSSAFKGLCTKARAKLGAVKAGEQAR